MKDLMAPEEVAALLGVPISTLYRWRHTDAGPPAIRVGRHLRYRRDALETWLEEREAAER